MKCFSAVMSFKIADFNKLFGSAVSIAKRSLMHRELLQTLLLMGYFPNEGLLNW